MRAAWRLRPPRVAADVRPPASQSLAAALPAENIMSIYGHFRWRYRVAAGSKWKGSKDDDRWQDDYRKDAKRCELDFWMGEAG